MKNTYTKEEIKEAIMKLTTSNDENPKNENDYLDGYIDGYHDFAPDLMNALEIEHNIEFRKE